MAVDNPRKILNKRVYIAETINSKRLIIGEISKMEQNTRQDEIVIDLGELFAVVMRRYG